MSTERGSRVDLLSKATEEELAGRWSEASRTLAQLIEENPTPELLLRLAIALDEAGACVEAEDAVRRAIAGQPIFPSAYFFLGALLDDQDRFDEAKQALETGLGQRDDADALTVLGTIFHRNGDLAGARRHFERALVLDPQNDEAHYGLGLVVKKVDPELSLQHLRRAATLDPKLEGVSRELGFALWRAKDYEEAEQALKAAVEVDPHDGWAHDYLGHLMMRKGEIILAKAEFSLAVESDPTVAAFWCNMAEATARVGQSSAADNLFREALSRDPGDPYVNLKYGLFLKSQGRRGRARFYLERTVSIDPTDERALQALRDLIA